MNSQTQSDYRDGDQTSSVQFQILHLFYLMLSFSIAATIFSYDVGLGITLFTLTIGFWSGYLLIGISNFMDEREFDERQFGSQLLNTLGILLVGSCGSLGGMLISLTALGALSWLVI